MSDESLEVQIGAIVVTAAEAAVPDVIETLRKTAPKMLAEEREMRQGFEERLETRWREPFNLFQMILTSARELVAEFDQQHRDGAADEQDFTFEVLHRLAVRACRVASEVLCLLRGGFADGAYARWRTLHELAAIAFFIQRAGGDTAERYLLYEYIEAVKSARAIRKHAPKLKAQPLTDEEMKDLEATRVALIDRFGPSFGNENGWALEALRRLEPDSKQATFEALERCAGLSHMRPYYKMACHQVHGGPKGAAFTLSLMRDIRINNVGASNAGLAEPGQGTCISLVQLLTTLSAHKPDLDRLIATRVLQSLTSEAAGSFVAVQKELEREEEEERRSATSRRRARHRTSMKDSPAPSSAG